MSEEQELLLLIAEAARKFNESHAKASRNMMTAAEAAHRLKILLEATPAGTFAIRMRSAD